MTNQNELALKFGEFCEKASLVLPKLAIAGASNNESRIGLPVYTIQIGDLSHWWDDQNRKDFVNQMNLLWDHDPDLYNQIIEQAFEILYDNPDHVDQYERVRHWVDSQGHDDFLFQQYLPHPIGMLGSPYGAYLFEQIAFQELRMSMDILGIETTLYYSSNPEQADLSKSFQLVVNLSTADKSPLLPKITQGQARGLFMPMFGATKPN